MSSKNHQRHSKIETPGKDATVSTMIRSESGATYIATVSLLPHLGSYKNYKVVQWISDTSIK